MPVIICVFLLPKDAQIMIDDKTLIAIVLCVSIGAQLTAIQEITLRSFLELVLCTLSVALPVAVHLVDAGYSRDYMLAIMAVVGISGEEFFKQIRRSMKKEGLIKRIIDAILKKH